MFPLIRELGTCFVVSAELLTWLQMWAEELLGTFINQGLTGAMKSTPWKLAWGQFSLSGSTVCFSSFDMSVRIQNHFLQKLPAQTLVSLRYPGYAAELQNKKRMILVGLNLHGKRLC